MKEQKLKCCSKCMENKPATLEYFYKQKRNKDGLTYDCKECRKKNNYEYYLENKEKQHEQKREKYNNDDEHRKEKLSKQKKINAKNRSSRTIYVREWQRENRDKLRGYGLNRMNKKHDITEQEWEDCKKFFNYSCAYCGMSEADHLLTEGQQLHKEHLEHNGANDITNCVPSCKSCNSQKWEFQLEEWYSKDNPVYSKRRFNKIIKWLNNVHELV
jgi:hypothetical protein